MYCSSCGTQVGDDASFCAKCGTRIAPSTPTVGTPPQTPATNVSAKKQLHGIGGWLGLLVVGLTILGPLLGGSRISGAFTDAEFKTPQLTTFAPWLSYKMDIWVIFGIVALISFCTGILLFRLKPSSVRIAIVSLWIVGPGGAIADIVAANSVFRSDIASAMSQTMWPSVIASGIAAAIWTAYLVRSKRVKNTYYLSGSVP